MLDFIGQIHWRPSIGDPNIMGWVTVLAYIACAFLCAQVYLNYKKTTPTAKKPMHFWGLLSVLMLFLALNKQLDLQSLLTDIGRLLAHQQGWYNQRKSVQKLFLIGAISSGMLATLVLARIYWQWLHSLGLAIAGMCFVIVFIVMRASSFHGMDKLINLTVMGIRLNWVLELTGLILIAWNAGLLLRQHRTQKSTSHSKHP